MLPEDCHRHIQPSPHREAILLTFSRPVRGARPGHPPGRDTRSRSPLPSLTPAPSVPSAVHRKHEVIQRHRCAPGKAAKNIADEYYLAFLRSCCRCFTTSTCPDESDMPAAVEADDVGLVAPADFAPITKGTGLSTTGGKLSLDTESGPFVKIAAIAGVS